jgi:hypothetical protein
MFTIAIIIAVAAVPTFIVLACCVVSARAERRATELFNRRESRSSSESHTLTAAGSTPAPATTHPIMTTPIQRVTRLLDEGARFMVELPGQMSIDLTPDVIAAMAEASGRPQQLDGGRNLLKSEDGGGDVPTLIEFT